MIPPGFEDEINPDNLKNYPSPEELKHKYIIKCKAPRRVPKALTEKGQMVFQKFTEQKLLHSSRPSSKRASQNPSRKNSEEIKTISKPISDNPASYGVGGDVDEPSLESDLEEEIKSQKLLDEAIMMKIS